MGSDPSDELSCRVRGSDSTACYTDVGPVGFGFGFCPPCKKKGQQPGTKKGSNELACLGRHSGVECRGLGEPLGLMKSCGPCWVSRRAPNKPLQSFDAGRAGGPTLFVYTYAGRVGGPPCFSTLAPAGSGDPLFFYTYVGASLVVVLSSVKHSRNGCQLLQFAIIACSEVSQLSA